VSKRLMAMLVGAMALAAIVAGCGSGDSDPLTKAEFTKQAEAFCKENRKEVQANFNSLMKKFQAAEDNKSDEAKAIEIGETVVIPYYQSKLDDLESLQPPSADEEQISKMLETFNKGLEEAEERPEDSLEGFASNTAAIEMAKKNGLKACALG
jgi:hypothetical protein